MLQKSVWVPGTTWLLWLPLVGSEFLCSFSPWARCMSISRPASAGLSVLDVAWICGPPVGLGSLLLQQLQVGTTPPSTQHLWLDPGQGISQILNEPPSSRRPLPVSPNMSASLIQPSSDAKVSTSGPIDVSAASLTTIWLPETFLVFAYLATCKFGSFSFIVQLDFLFKATQ